MHGILATLTARSERHPRLTALAVFVLVALIYLINPDPFWSGDLNSSSIFAINLLEFRTIHLDAFANSELFKQHGTFSFSQSVGSIGAGRHWTLAYPVGTAVVTFPIYAVLYAYLKLAAPAIDVTSAAFEPYRLAFSHITATVVSAATVALFFLISRRRFSTGVALMTTACLAFATMQWGLLSQSLLQHSPGSFLIMASAYLLLRADDSDGARAGTLLGAAGALAGLLFMVRPTYLPFMAALATFAVLRMRARTLPFALAFLVTFGLALAWNYAHFQTWIGAYATLIYNFNYSLATFVQGFIGLAISPIRGLIPNSPFLLFTLAGIAAAAVAILGAVRRWDFHRIDADLLLFGMLLGASAVLYLSHSFSPFWEGLTYGTRFLSETMPILVYFLNFAAVLHPRRPGNKSRRASTATFAALVAVGVMQQVTAIVGGAQGQGLWSVLPYYELDLPEDRRWAYMWDAPLRNFETRLWNVRDGLIERIWRGVYSSRFEMSPAIAAAMNYAARCQATIVSVRDNDGKPVDQFRLQGVDSRRPLLERLKESFSVGRKFVHVRVRNDGEVPLYGYQTGNPLGLARMTYKQIDEAGGIVFESQSVYVSGTIAPGETGDALGSMDIKMTPGRYRVEGRMVSNGIGDCGPPRDLGTMQVDEAP